MSRSAKLSGGVDPASFRRDPFLRTSAYNMGTWAFLNALFSVPAYAMAYGAAWPPPLVGGYSLTLLLTGVGLGAVHDRRVAKMVGPAGEPLFPAAKLWGPLLLTGFLTTVCLVIGDRSQFIQPLWLLIVGSAYVIWGTSIGLPLYTFLGAVLTVVGAAVLAMQSTGAGEPPSVVGLNLWNLTMGGLSLAVAVAANRRYLWVSAGDDVGPLQ